MSREARASRAEGRAQRANFLRYFFSRSRDSPRDGPEAAMTRGGRFLGSRSGTSPGRLRKFWKAFLIHRLPNPPVVVSEPVLSLIKRPTSMEH